jgi:hypothetical protein
LQAPNLIRHNGLVDEFDYALRAGYTPDVTGEITGWFDLPRTTRAAIVASMRLKDLSAGLSKFDQEDFWERYYERKSARKGKRKGGQ